MTAATRATMPVTPPTPATRVTTPATRATRVTTRATPGTTAPPDRADPGALHPGSDALALTLAPVDGPRFFAEHWERRPLLVPRDDPERFSGILGTGDVGRLVCETGIRTPGFRLVREGAQPPPAGYTED